MPKKRPRRNYRKDTSRNWDDPVYKNWRQQVLKRDKRVCRWPNCKSKKRLQVHHIRTWAHNPGLRFIVDNGITLCYAHHNLIKGKEIYYEALFTKIVKNYYE